MLFVTDVTWKRGVVAGLVAASADFVSQLVARFSPWKSRKVSCGAGERLAARLTFGSCLARSNSSVKSQLVTA